MGLRRYGPGTNDERDRNWDLDWPQGPPARVGLRRVVLRHCRRLVGPDLLKDAVHLAEEKEALL